MNCLRISLNQMYLNLYLNFRLDKDMLDEKIQSSKDAKIDDRFYPQQILYPNSNRVQYMLNLGMSILTYAKS